jgi:hypothetical protein
MDTGVASDFCFAVANKMMPSHQKCMKQPLFNAAAASHCNIPHPITSSKSLAALLSLKDAALPACTTRTGGISVGSGTWMALQIKFTFLSTPMNLGLDMIQDASFYLSSPGFYFFRTIPESYKRNDVTYYYHTSTKYHTNRTIPSIHWV